MTTRDQGPPTWIRARRRVRVARIGPLPVASLGAWVLCVVGGCQSYEARPISLSSHEAAFLARTPESPEVAAFAASLSGGGEAAPGGFDLGDGISLAEAEAVAMVFNAELRTARLRAGVTRAGADNAGLWEDPELGVDVTRIIESVTHPWMIAGSIGLTLPVSGRLDVEKSLAGKEHNAELARVVEREWATRIEVRAEWARWWAVRAQAESTQEFLARVDQVLDIVDTMERAGEIARTEARLFRVERATRASDLRLLSAEVAEREVTMKQLMGLAPSSSVALTPAPVLTSRDLADLSDGPVDEANPSLAAAMAEYDAAEESLRLEVRKQYPDLTLGPGYGNEDGNNQLMLGVSLPIPILNANRRGIAEASAMREVARGTVEATLERLVTETARAQLRAAAASEHRRSLETEIVPLVDAQYDDAREIARIGELNTLVLLETLARQHEAKVRLIEAVRDESLAVIRLQELRGPPPRIASPAAAPASDPQPAAEGAIP